MEIAEHGRLYYTYVKALDVYHINRRRFLLPPDNIGFVIGAADEFTL